MKGGTMNLELKMELEVPIATVCNNTYLKAKQIKCKRCGEKAQRFAKTSYCSYKCLRASLR
jgi:hypothetical protein